MLFPSETRGKIERFKKEVTDVYSFASNLELRRLQMKYMTLDEFEKVKAIQKFLNHKNVEYKVSIRWEWWPILKRYEEIDILASGYFELNRQARKLSELYQTKIVYSPKVLSELGAYGAHCPALRTIYVSEFMAKTDSLDLTYLHEVRHMAMTHKEESGQATVVNGDAIKNGFLKDKWPWGRTSKSGYDNYFSLQEAETWHQYFVYSLVHIRQLATDRKLNYAELHQLIEAIKQRNSSDMIEDTLALVKYELGLLRNNIPSIYFEKDKQKFSFGRRSLLFSYGHTIPRKFIEEFLAEKNTDFVFDEKSIKTPAGISLAKEMIQLFLSRLHENLQAKLEYFKRSFLLLEEIQRRAIFLQTLNSPFELLEQTLSNLGCSNDFDVFQVDQILLNQLSRLPMGGLDFSTVHTSLYKKSAQKFSSSDENRWLDIKKFIYEATFFEKGGAGYSKVELTVRSEGVESVLILEGTPQINLSRISFDLLSRKNVEIVKVEVRTVEFSQIEKKDHSSVDLSFLRLKAEETQARNQLRIELMIESLKK